MTAEGRDEAGNRSSQLNENPFISSKLLSLVASERTAANLESKRLGGRGSGRARVCH